MSPQKPPGRAARFSLAAAQDLLFRGSSAGVEAFPGPPVVLSVRVRAVNSSNAREHWGARKRRAALHKAAVWGSYIALGKALVFTGPLSIKLIRIGKRKMDTDGLAISLKHVRDGVAEVIRRDDGDESITWEYAQEAGKVYGVRIEIRRRDGSEG